MQENSGGGGTIAQSDTEKLLEMLLINVVFTVSYLLVGEGGFLRTVHFGECVFLVHTKSTSPL